MPKSEQATAGVEVVVVIGTGALGLAAARRIGAGRHIFLADLPGRSVDAAAEALTSSGHQFTVCPTDASDPAAVSALATAAEACGMVRTIVHTAGISPTQGTPADILRVNLFGTALVLDAFLAVAQRGTTIVCIASQGGYRIPVSSATERLLAVTPTEKLLDLTALDADSLNGAEAYAISKRGVHVRVEAESIRWATRGARAVTVSPGFTVTPQSLQELNGPHRGVITGMLERASTRLGTPDDIAAAIEFLASPAASFINGIDLRVDGGVIANERWSDPAKPGSYFLDREPV
jgi:NAD(P)-dependent dehydrogenase (short-subunit alcohol dehydrogenase family)